MKSFVGVMGGKTHTGAYYYIKRIRRLLAKMKEPGEDIREEI